MVQKGPEGLWLISFASFFWYCWVRAIKNPLQINSFDFSTAKPNCTPLPSGASLQQKPPGLSGWAQGRCRWSMLTWFLGSSLRHRTAFYLPLFPDQNIKVKEWRRHTLQFQSTSVSDLGSAVIEVHAYSDNVAGFRPLPLFQLSIIPPSKPAFHRFGHILSRPGLSRDPEYESILSQGRKVQIFPIS